MKYKAIFRILSLAVILSLLVVAIPATSALAYDKDIELNPERGEIGDEVTITGEDFAPSTEGSERLARIYFAKDEAGYGEDIGDDVETYERVGSEWVGFDGDSDEGDFETTFTVPTRLGDGSDDEDVELGTYYIYVTILTGTGSETFIYSVAEFTVIPGGEITIDLDDGPAGTEVEITGKDFGNEEAITVEYDGDDIDIESGDDETDLSGEFEATIIIPESITGDHTITVKDESGSEAEATFTVEPEIAISPAEGSVQSTATVDGTGFDSRSDIVLSFGGSEVATDRTDSDGSFEATFNVPEKTPGTYVVKAKDEDNNSATAQFSVIRPISASINPTTGNVGSELTTTGAGYTAGGTVTIKYDTTEVATVIVETNGAFSATFEVPSSQHGDHSVTVSDGTITKQFTFTMESEAPPVTQPLLPEMRVKVEQPVRFDWEDVTDDSPPVTYSLQIATSRGFEASYIVLEKEGLTESGYTLTKAEELEPVGEKEPYYWRVKAIDGASNEGEWTGAGEFYTGGSGFALPTWVIYLLFGLGALLFGALGFWLGRRSAYYSY